MSALGLGMLFVLSFTVGISWLAWALDARMGRSRLVRQLPLPLDNLSRPFGQSTRSGLQPVKAIVGFMLVFFAALVDRQIKRPIMRHIAAHLLAQASARKSILLVAVLPFRNTGSQPTLTQAEYKCLNWIKCLMQQEVS